MMDFLTREQLELLTGFKLKSAQVRGLRRMGIEHKVRPDGFPIVSTTHIEKLLGGRVETQQSVSEPNFGAL